MKVILVRGMCPAGTCGVSDYTARLETELSSLGLDVESTIDWRWSLWDIGVVVNNLRNLRPDIVHIQYPTVGFGYHLGPQMLALRNRSVVTLHEASQSHLLRQLSLYPFVIRARHLIFTSIYEREYARKWAPWISRVSTVIPVGSNVSPVFSDVERREREIAYFGLVMPGKGLEEVLELAALIKSTDLDFKVRIIGNAHERHKAYSEQLRTRSQNLPVIWQDKLAVDDLSRTLAQCSFAYLPFPDGASERRTTLKAMLDHGVVTITKRGTQTPKDLNDVVYFSNSPEETCRALRFLSNNRSLQESLRRNSLKYMRQFSWNRIARDHIRVYEAIGRANAVESSMERLHN